MILFLDFDGVLHPHKQNNENLFCRTPLLWQILRACTDAQVVFSTSWRDCYRFDEMVEFVTWGGGEYLAYRFIGSIPNLEGEGRYGRRDLEIQSWLDANGHVGWWLAIDDIPELFNGGHPNLYIVDGSRGLTDADVAAIIGRIQSQLGASYLETAFTAEDIQRAIAEEERLGARSVPCDFLKVY
jgi:HAD domain in Swiss Army Knife RNA repair proteins